MATVYTSRGDSNILKKISWQINDPFPNNVVWIDMSNPSKEEESHVEKLLDINIPSRKEIGIIEVMSPFYKEHKSYYMTITIINPQDDGYLDGVALTIILSQSYLVTVQHGENIGLIKTMSQMVTKDGTVPHTPDSLLIMIMELCLNSIADVLENSGNNLDAMLKAVFKKATESEQKAQASYNYYNDTISKIGQMGNSISKNRESLVSVSRLIIYYEQIDYMKYSTSGEYRTKLAHIEREVKSLTEYANFLSQRNGFFLEAILGMVSVEHNSIMKVFTVAAAVFMPPTLIASVYGMNFDYMPEIHWALGYPIVLVFIIISALIPYWFCKKRGWL